MSLISLFTYIFILYIFIVRVLHRADTYGCVLQTTFKIQIHTREFH